MVANTCFIKIKKMQKIIDENVNLKINTIKIK